MEPTTGAWTTVIAAGATAAGMKALEHYLKRGDREMSLLEKQEAKWEERFKTLQSRLDSLENDNRQLFREKTEQAAQIATLTGERDGLREKVRLLEAEVAELRQHVNQLEERRQPRGGDLS